MLTITPSHAVCRLLGGSGMAPPTAAPIQTLPALLAPFQPSVGRTRTRGLLIRSEFGLAETLMGYLPEDANAEEWREMSSSPHCNDGTGHPCPRRG